ncbi:hypothetical protein QFC19_008992 [Naganishia cerealis]|uniref:Uncharacterized protein n=1 Tax=Naganishia cerealis TaxID=610337 RepID=A0ACC2UY93_9TREE|nr:hypothetical protein QFC19_008992 [Naganishia cerealis]
MSDPFFARENKRKRSGPAPYEKPYRPAAYGKGQKSGANVDGRRRTGNGAGARSAGGRATRDEDLASDNEDADGRGRDAGDVDDIDFMADRLGGHQAEYDSAEEEDRSRNETAAAKRLRLAKGYLDKVRSEVQGELVVHGGDWPQGLLLTLRVCLGDRVTVDDGSWDAQEVDNANVAARLQQDVDEAAGRIHSFFATALQPSTFSHKFVPSVGGKVPTAAQASLTDLFTATKEGVLARYSFADDLKMVGSLFGQVQSGDSKSGGKRGGKSGSQGVKPNGNKQSRGSGSADKTVQQGHTGAVLCLVASEDGKYLITGGKDKMIGVWQVEPVLAGVSPAAGTAGVKWLRGLGGHKDAVTGLALPALNNPSHQFVSASAARSLCMHSISTLSLIDTFFGHQDSINAVSSIKPTIAVTTGARDRTCRWWKLEEEVQLVFRAGIKSVEGGHVRKPVAAAGTQDLPPTAAAATNGTVKEKRREFVEGSVDTVAMLDDQHFVSGGDSGAICLWHTGKKKPVFTEHLAHGTTQHDSESEGEMVEPRWITALAGLRGTNLFASGTLITDPQWASGSWNGEIKLWALAPTLKSFSYVCSVTAAGVVNSLQLLSLPHGNVNSNAWRKQSTDNEAVNDEEVEMEASDQASSQVAPSKRARMPADVLLVASLAREPRLGRWIKVKNGAKNGTLVVNLGRP